MCFFILCELENELEKLRDLYFVIDINLFIMSYFDFMS